MKGHLLRDLTRISNPLHEFLGVLFGSRVPFESVMRKLMTDQGFHLLIVSFETSMSMRGLSSGTPVHRLLNSVIVNSFPSFKICLWCVYAFERIDSRKVFTDLAFELAHFIRPVSANQFSGRIKRFVPISKRSPAIVIRM